jgi:hypothetical protein
MLLAFNMIVEKGILVRHREEGQGRDVKPELATILLYKLEDHNIFIHDN